MYLSVGIVFFFFLIQLVIFLAVSITGDFLLYPGHLGCCVRKFQVLFKSYFSSQSPYLGLACRTWSTCSLWFQRHFNVEPLLCCFSRLGFSGASRVSTHPCCCHLWGERHFPSPRHLVSGFEKEVFSLHQ